MTNDDPNQPRNPQKPDTSGNGEAATTSVEHISNPVDRALKQIEQERAERKRRRDKKAKRYPARKPPPKAAQPRKRRRKRKPSKRPLNDQQREALRRANIAKKALGKLANGGRPSLYRVEFAKQAETLCAQYGATLAELAAFFRVTVQTVKNWCHHHPDFFTATKIAREVADSRIERSLYERAAGYTFDSEEVRVIDGAVVKVPIKEHVPPDVVASIFWLKNRKPAEWRDQLNVEGNLRLTPPSDLDLARFIAATVEGAAQVLEHQPTPAKPDPPAPQED